MIRASKFSTAQGDNVGLSHVFRRFSVAKYPTDREHCYVVCWLERGRDWVDFEMVGANSEMAQQLGKMEAHTNQSLLSHRTLWACCNLGNAKPGCADV